MAGGPPDDDHQHPDAGGRAGGSEARRSDPRLLGYQPLIRTYIGQGLRQDLERLDRNPGLERLLESLRRQGVDEEVLSSAIAEVRAQS